MPVAKFEFFIYDKKGFKSATNAILVSSGSILISQLAYILCGGARKPSEASGK